MSCIQTDATELKIDILGMSFLALLIRMCLYAGIDRGCLLKNASVVLLINLEIVGDFEWYEILTDTWRSS